MQLDLLQAKHIEHTKEISTLAQTLSDAQKALSALQIQHESAQRALSALQIKHDTEMNEANSELKRKNEH